MHTNSPVWNDLLKVKRLYQQGRVMVVGDGKATDFWEDAWCGTVSLKEFFFRIIHNQQQHIGYCRGTSTKRVEVVL